MAIHLGPNIPKEGLIFSVDPASTKSWDGLNYRNTAHLDDSTTITGTITHVTDGGGTFTFGANGSYFNYGTTSPLRNLYDVSLVGWVKQGSTGSPHQTVIGTSSSYLYGLKLMSRYHGAAAAWMGDGGGASHLLSSNVDITGDGEYHLLACTRNGGTGDIKIYVDGVLKNTVGFTNTNGNFRGGVNDSGNTLLGADYHSVGYYHTGNIGQVYGYNITLSDDEILQIYNNGKERYGL